MKARADDRRLLSDKENPPVLNVHAIQETKSFDLDEFASHLKPFGIARSSLAALIETFKDGKNLGSLIQVPEGLVSALPSIIESLGRAITEGDLYAKAAAFDLSTVVFQAALLSRQYDAVVANPPYMGSKGMNPKLKDYSVAAFPKSKSDLFAMFVERGFNWCKPSGFNSMVTMQSWMFLSSFEEMRSDILREHTLSCMVHMGNGVMGIAFGTAATVMLNNHIVDYVGHFSYCDNNDIGADGTPKQFPVPNNRLKCTKPDNFSKLPGSPVAYWAPEPVLEAFGAMRLLSESVPAKSGQNTGDNARFLRFWPEVDFRNIGFGVTSLAETLKDGPKWLPYNKGGAYRKWYGNFDFVINWAKNGQDIKDYAVERNNGKHWSRYIQNLDFMLKEGITWTFISSSYFGARYTPPGHMFDYAGCSAFPTSKDRMKVLALFCSTTSTYILNFLNPTLNLQPGNVGNLPIPPLDVDTNVKVSHIATRAVELSKEDWDSFETSWGFQKLPMLQNILGTLSETYNEHCETVSNRFEQLRRLEAENNSIFINAFGLQDELNPEVSLSDLTLVGNDRGKDSARFVSYALGCLMGRYSLDAPGVVYAGANSDEFDNSLYPSFAPDEDGIVVATDENWFADDATNRLREFLVAIWGIESLNENLVWLAEGLGAKSTEIPEETLRRYISDKFYKDHLQAYKKRPIYWLFSSGKQGAFQALVYLHRYNINTLPRMRSEYVLPLASRLASRLELLENDSSAATSAVARTKLQKQIEILRKKKAELSSFDEKLRHFADMRIAIDLDDGVKVNYAKFGDLVAESKAITGGSDE